jgi:hypothetical protein
VLLVNAGSWQEFVGYFPDDAATQAQLHAPLSVSVTCLFAGDGLQWSGTIYVDDISID